MYIEELFDTILNIGYGLVKSPIHERFNQFCLIYIYMYTIYISLSYIFFVKPEPDKSPVARVQLDLLLEETQ